MHSRRNNFDEFLIHTNCFGATIAPSSLKIVIMGHSKVHSEAMKSSKRFQSHILFWDRFTFKTDQYFFTSNSQYIILFDGETSILLINMMVFREIWETR